MKTYMKLSIMAALLAAFLALTARGTTALSPPSAGRAISAPDTYPLLIGATGDDHSGLLLSFAQGVALPPLDPQQLSTVAAEPSQPTQAPTLPATGSTDTGSIVAGLVGLALRLLIVGGLVLFFRSRRRT